jgi:hypothetical protein
VSLGRSVAFFIRACGGGVEFQLVFLTTDGGDTILVYTHK